MIGNARQRISETIGGKMATAIKARRDSAVKSSSSPAAAMQTNSISASNETVDRAAEVAAFRDGKHGPDGDNT
ncbi:hypothetical protein IP91_04070 [Pseudoduganella lurida]|uniref:Uncharacterized protein n=2 Tax=Pseudoduganella lurida TaxID=1036180 RepID=A0A562R0F3_9BURK|nr:hypothetical protein IP91_04070 [Pseudoduganella lurida]